MSGLIPPESGFVILLANGSIAHDIHAQSPAFWRSRSAARRALKRLPKWMGPAEVRPCDRGGKTYLVKE